VNRIAPAEAQRPREPAWNHFHDTRREPTSPCGPGAAPGKIASPTSALLRESVGHGSLVTEDQREVSPLSGGVMSQPLSGPLQAGLCFLPLPLPAAPSAHLTMRFPLTGGLRAYHVALRKHAWVRSRLYAGGSTTAPGEFGAPGPGHVPFGPSQQHLGLVLCDDAYSGSPGLTLPRLLVPDRLGAGSRNLRSRFGCHPCG